MDETTTMCSDCAQNRHLKNLIARDGVPLYCSICRQRQSKVFDLEQLADTLSAAIQGNFVPVGRDGDAPGDSLGTIVEGMLTQEVPYLNVLIETIIVRYDCGTRDHEEGFLDAGGAYRTVQHRVSAERLEKRWRELECELKHKRRFFSESVKAFFDDLFAELVAYSTWDVNELGIDPVVRTLASGMHVFRARAIESERAGVTASAPLSEVGPPPRDKARSMRMSPEGVVALYAAMESQTAIAELRPAIGGTVAVVELALTKPLHVLDFERLERVLDAGWSELLHPRPQVARETWLFLRKLHRLIASPVMPGHEDDYLMTQSMAEYLARVHPLKLDGILFKSVQHQDGTNLVVFPDRDAPDGEDRFPIDYVRGSLSFHRVNRVAYAVEKLALEHDGDGDLWLHSEAQLQEREEAWRDGGSEEDA